MKEGKNLVNRRKGTKKRKKGKIERIWCQKEQKKTKKGKNQEKKGKRAQNFTKLENLFSFYNIQCGFLTVETFKKPLSGSV